MQNTTEVAQQARRIEELVAKLESSGDPAIVSAARALVEALMDLHGAALERMLEIVAHSGAAGEEIASRFGRDDLVGSLLILYGLHPLDLESRVRRALEKLEPHLRKQGAEATVSGLDGGVVRVRVHSGGTGCGAAPGSLRAAVEEALFAAAPDVTAIEIEGLETTGPASGFVPLEKLSGVGAL